MEQDIHGVADTIEETDEFVGQKIQELKDALNRIVEDQKTAWDRAVFLRPSLGCDKPLYLMFLRAARFDVKRAAKSLVFRFELKRRLFGDYLLIQRITWEDLTVEDQAMVKSGFFQLIPNRVQTGRGTLFSRFCLWDASNPTVHNRASFYILQAIEDYPEIQRRGVVSIADFRGSWKSRFLQVVKLFGEEKETFDNLSFHNATSHLMYDDPKMNPFIQALRAVVNKDQRMRHRIHIGSDVEIDYCLRTFGIDVSDCLAHDSSVGPMSLSGLQEDIQRRQKIDEEWRRSEAPYRDPLSRLALVPNPRDIVLGHNKKVAPTWPGNIAYHALIDQQAQQYLLVDDDDRFTKTSIAIQVLGILRKRSRARFLARKDNLWEVIDDKEAHRKISQALRSAAKGAKEQLSL